MASKPVRLSDETMDLLKKHAVPFESPDECMKRVLSKNPCKMWKSDSEENQESETNPVKMEIDE